MRSSCLRTATICLIVLAAVGCVTRRERAERAMADGDYNRAVTIWEQVLTKAPGDVEARSGLRKARTKRLEALEGDVARAHGNGNVEGAAQALAKSEDYAAELGADLPASLG